MQWWHLLEGSVLSWLWRGSLAIERLRLRFGYSIVYALHSHCIPPALALALALGLALAPARALSHIQALDRLRLHSVVSVELRCRLGYSGNRT